MPKIESKLKARGQNEFDIAVEYNYKTDLLQSVIGEMFAGKEEPEQIVRLAETFKTRLSEGLEKGEDGKLTMKISLPDEGVLDNIAKSLARMMSLT